jgi:Uma2 family endonuclease
MRAVMPEVRPEILDWRRRTGADRWDEMWDGELHMPPEPNLAHQDLALSLVAWLEIHWKGSQRGNRVRLPVNVAPSGGWPHDYRIPDLMLVRADSRGVDRGEYYEGPPTVVIEIRSPGDESYEKLSFYAKLGVPEVWIIHRDTKAPEVYVLDAGRYEKQLAGEEGWISSAATGIQLRPSDGKLSVEMIDDPHTRRVLPED